MCGRYWIDPEPREELMEIIARIQRTEGQGAAKVAGEVFPGDRVPVLCRSRAGNLRPFAMDWGYTLPDGKKLINARSETAAEKPLFRESVRLRRCLLPMSAYFEWEKRADGKRKYRIAPAEEGLFYLAGLYRFEGARPVCTVLSRAAAPEIEFIHGRMPVLLSAAAREDWIFEGRADFSRSPHLEYHPA